SAIFAGHAVLAARGVSASTDARVITISDAWLEREAQARATLLGVSTDEIDRAALRLASLREEALVREARALGLDAGDLVVRRRLVQKLELVLRARLEVVNPDDAALEAWLATHADRYREPARIRFEHVFFASDQRTDGAQPAAQAAASRLREGTDRKGLGDAFPLGPVIGPRDVEAIARGFGTSFTEAVANAKTNTWVGPLKSRHGTHVVRVLSRTPGRVPPLDAVRAQVLADARSEAEDRALEEATGRIVARYDVREAAE
ncbi:MAG: peptidylprolyl isomerase, partial [Myxococcota bacterium]